jgi:O-succinylbenzoic acid--CoA ligase
VRFFPSHITLNGRRTEISSLIQRQPTTTGWKKEWLDFLSEWYAPEEFIIVNTSGSTGKPKTIKLSKAFVAASAQRTLLYFRLKKDNKVLHCLPSRYIAGKLMIVRSLLGQLDLHIADPSTDFSFLKHTDFHFAAMVSNQVIKILDSENGISKLQHIEKLLIGGSRMPLKLQERLQKATTEVYSSYAMTETATHVAIRKINGRGADEFYRCMEGISVSLSPEGCLRLHVPGLDETNGSNPKQDTRIKDQDTSTKNHILNPKSKDDQRPNQSYLQTTDLAEIKDEKTFRILGRADHVIISGGIKFSPERIEQKLEAFISQPFMISSLPDDRLGEQIILLIEGNEEPEILPHLKEICRQHLDQYECPRQVRFIPRLPRTPNGKLIRLGGLK